MKSQLTEEDLRSPDYKGFWMDLVSSKNNITKNTNSKK